MSRRFTLLLAIGLAGGGVADYSVSAVAIGASSTLAVRQTLFSPFPFDPTILLAQAEPTTDSLPSLEPGSRGPEVLTLQVLLQRAGYYNQQLDGVYGEQTQSAMREFQRQMGLPVTGEVDAETWERLQALNPGVDISELFGADAEDDSAPLEDPEAGSEEASSTPAGENGSDPAASEDLGISMGNEAEAGSEAESASQGSSGRRVLLVAMLIGTTGIVVHTLGHYGLIRLPTFRQMSLFLRRLSLGGPAPAAVPRRLGARPVTSSRRSPTFNRANSSSSSSSPSSEVSGPSALSTTSTAPTGDSQSGQDSPEPLLMTPTRVTPPSQQDVVRQLAVDLHSSDPAKRRRAIWELGQQGGSDAIQPLMSLMAGSDSHQRCLVLAAISEIGIRTLKPINVALITSLRDENADVRKNSIRELTRIYDLVMQVNQHLHYATHDADEDVRKTAQWALGRIDHTLAQSETSLPDLSSFVQSSDSSSSNGSAGDEPSAANSYPGDRSLSN